MLILGLDTAASGCGVALASGEQVLVEYRERAGRTYLSRLMPLVEAALAAAGCGRSDLGAVAATAGPGSYTGLRIGLATAKALAYALGIPAVGVPTLEAIAFGAGPRPAWVCPLLDARRGRVYTALYRWEGDAVVEVEPARVADARDWFARLAGRETFFTGDGVEQHGRAALAALGASASLAHPLAAAVRPGAVAVLGYRRLRRGAGEDPARLAPLYLGGVDARGGGGG